MPSSGSAKRKFAIMVGVLALLLLTVVFWGLQTYRRTDASLGQISFQWFILVLLLVFIVPLLVSMRRDIKQGLPIEDERSRRNKFLAGYYAYLVSIYLWLAIMFFDKYFTVDSAVAAAMLGSAVTFGVAYAILSRKPKAG